MAESPDESQGKDSPKTQEVEHLKTQLADTQFELDGCRNTVAKLSAEIRRLRQRFRASSEGDLGCQ